VVEEAQPLGTALDQEVERVRGDIRGPCGRSAPTTSARWPCQWARSPRLTRSYATNIITGLSVSLQATALPVAVIAVGIWIAYSVDGGLDAHRAHLAYLDGHRAGRADLAHYS
jgi:hypothetical protein